MVRVNRFINKTAEFRRIRDLPRRQPSTVDLVQQLTKTLGRGGQTLRPCQALALRDIGVCRGAFLPLGVGEGKTLVSLLAPVVVQAKRPILLCPAALVEKTERDRIEYSKYWKVPTHLRILSYEQLGRVNGANTLGLWRPDLIIPDECHKLKNKDAAVTRRVWRYMDDQPETMFVAMSGTVMSKSIKDYAHILRWCLKNNAPIPNHEGDLIEWSNALDDGVNFLTRIQPGALLDFGGTGDTPLERARDGYRKRLVETPGVVASLHPEGCDASLYIRPLRYDVSPQTERHFETLRSLWETPDGWAFTEAVECWRHARELALEMVYLWHPRPQNEWLEKRRDWAKFVRETIQNSKTLDSEKQVALECIHGKLGDFYYRAWKNIEPTFKINQIAEWHGDSALRVCGDWLRHGGLVWCEHIEFADKLSAETGVPYFGAGGLNAKNESIDQYQGKAAILSVAANIAGRNLQRFSRNLLASPPMSALGWEQLIGRTHRPGQKADTVTVDYLFGCVEHHQGVVRGREGAKFHKSMQGTEQKLLLADLEVPSLPIRGFRWQKVQEKKES